MVLKKFTETPKNTEGSTEFNSGLTTVERMNFIIQCGEFAALNNNAVDYFRASNVLLNSINRWLNEEQRKKFYKVKETLYKDSFKQGASENPIFYRNVDIFFTEVLKTFHEKGLGLRMSDEGKDNL